MRTATQSDYRDRVLAVVAHLAEHLDEAPDLALEAGFRDQTTFTRAFRNAYGVPRGRLRADGLPAHEIPSLTEIHFSPHSPPCRILLPNLDREPMTIEFTHLEPRRYAYLAHKGLYPEIGATFGRMAEIAGRAGLIRAPDALFVGVYHSDPCATRVEDLRSDAGITVAEDTTIPPELQESHLPGGRYAKGIHKGPYSKMGEAWGDFWSAIHASAAKPRPISPFEIYVSDMDTTPEDELITELYVAVE